MLSGHRPSLAAVESPAARASAVRHLVRLARRSSSFETTIGGPRPPTDGQAHLLMPTGQTLDAPDTSGVPLSGSSELHRHPCAVMSNTGCPCGRCRRKRHLRWHRTASARWIGGGVSRDSSNGGRARRVASPCGPTCTPGGVVVRTATCSATTTDRVGLQRRVPRGTSPSSASCRPPPSRFPRHSHPGHRHLRGPRRSDRPVSTSAKE